MTEPSPNLRPEFQARAQAVMNRLPAEQVHDLLVRCWVSHDARWFMAVAREFGLAAASRLNQAAVQDVARVEVRRLRKILDLPPLKTVEDVILAQEVMIAFLGSDLLEYEVIKTGPDSFEVRVQRCFARENVIRAGVAEEYDCGIFARMSAWPRALGVDLEMTPALGRCLELAGQDCVYRFTINT